MTDHSRQLQRETEAARVLREQLADLAGGEEEAVRDTIEGATNLHELIGAVVEDIASDCASIEGIDAHLKTMRGRKERLEARVESRRAVILNAMAIGEIKKLELAIATLSRKPVPSKALVLDETQIPAQFWKRADPTLDKRALLDALKGEQIIPGASLSNGSETIAIKWS